MLIYDAVGHLALTTAADPDGAVSLPLPVNLATGVYLVRTGHNTPRLAVK